jgi:hypothetical protein
MAETSDTGKHWEHMGKDTAHRKQERYQLEFGDPTEMDWELALGRTTGTEQTQIE